MFVFLVIFASYIYRLYDFLFLTFVFSPSLHAGNLILHDQGSGDGVPHSSPLSSLGTQMPQQKRHSYTASPQKSSTAASQHNRR